MYDNINLLVSSYRVHTNSQIVINKLTQLSYLRLQNPPKTFNPLNICFEGTLSAFHPPPPPPHTLATLSGQWTDEPNSPVN